MVEATFKSISPDCQKRTRTYGTNTWWSDNLPAMAIYCRQQFDENVSIKRVRKLRTTILNELYGVHHATPDKQNFKEH